MKRTVETEKNKPTENKESEMNTTHSNEEAILADEEQRSSTFSDSKRPGRPMSHIDREKSRKARLEAQKLAKTIDGRRSPTEAIREKCLDCNLTHHEVRWCPITSCSLWRWRFGKRPETVLRRSPELLDPDYIKAGSGGVK